MKKTAIIMFSMLLNLGLFSCTPQDINEELQTEQACCGEDGNFPPPPPPPPPAG
jgi:hypothetical protein